MRSSLKIGTALVAGILLATGCGSTATSSDPDAVVELSLWTGFTGPDRPAYENLVKQFNASHPKIKVTMDVQPWDAIAQKLPGAWATGQGPDLATPNFDPGVLFNYVKTNSLLPLDEAVGTGDGKLNAGTFPAAVNTAFTIDGKLYAAPANMATLVLYYNKAMFAEAGLQEPKTADEFTAAAKQLTKTEGDKVTQYGISLADHATIQMWPILQWMNGGDIVDAKGCATIAQPASVQALTTWADLVVKDKVSPIGQTGADADTLFSAKKAAMEINGPWAAAGFKEAGIDLGIAPVPVGAGGPVTLASTVPLAVGKSTKHKAQALEFLSWWTGKTAQAAFSDASGFPPVRTDVTSSNPVVAPFAAGLPHARLYLPGLPTSPKIDADVYVPLIGKITRGEPVEAAARSAAEAINQITGCTA
ncbi:ABC transporter substrate-binding protein [Acrocarpospora pleiomorpha]|uniref:ABC transporter substrate-binding protein n=1 Tax=Acrocarpospora pleiomorpha TaxID=90975 RepID=A0A5M3Y1T4_9ACTN|nr:ABC transporter substrate-binding protein [Acrocarpospora pleiomorpha]GES24678.1 ABC transporter substrate-binding protein [Acrocarpospora pleiomorpha]